MTPRHGTCHSKANLYTHNTGVEAVAQMSTPGEEGALLLQEFAEGGLARVELALEALQRGRNVGRFCKGAQQRVCGDAREDAPEGLVHLHLRHIPFVV